MAVFGSGTGEGKKVETFPISMMKMWDLPSFIKTLANWKTGASRPLICKLAARLLSSGRSPRLRA